MLACPAACALPPVIDAAGAITGAVQVYVVPAGTISVPLTGATVKAVALHIVAALPATAGRGFTVTVTVKFAPVQPPVTGVTVYVAVCGVFVGLVRVPLILAAAAPAAPPVTPPVTTGAAQV